jgi:hypothetical protein
MRTGLPALRFLWTRFLERRPLARRGDAQASGGARDALTIEWDRSQADLVGGAGRTALPAGIYECELAWVLRATCPGSFKASIQATAGSLVQISVIPITIIVQGQDL